jgi:hypothetical protein
MRDFLPEGFGGDASSLPSARVVVLRAGFFLGLTVSIRRCREG